LCAGAGGKDVTTSGSWRLFSALSIAATTARGASDNMGAVKTRLPSRPQTGHDAEAGGAPSGARTSNAPSSPH
jgi:hypothetical protein